jgi:hypothetical protein
LIVCRTAYDGGELVITGTGEPDIILVRRHDGLIRVDVRFGVGGEDADDDAADDESDGDGSHQRFDFNAADVTSIHILALGGNDHVHAGRFVTRSLPERVRMACYI